MKLKKYILPVISLLALSSCDYEEVNTNSYGITEEEMKQGGLLYGAPFMDMQKLVMPIGSPTESTEPGNALANTDLISAAGYIGFWGLNNNWNFGNEANWQFTEARMNYAYQNLYSNLFRSWNAIYKYTKDSADPNDRMVEALINVVKIAGWLRATDVFGPIVYTNAGNGDISPKVDSQKEVYQAMMADLHESAKRLSQATFKLLPTYDVIYNGNAQNWARLANSLLLRMAVRVHFKDDALAREYIGKALDPQFGGVIEDESQEAKIQSTDKMPLMNSMLPTVVDYKEGRLGATIWAYLKGYDDPRLDVWFTKGNYNGTSDYFALPPTNDQPKKEGAGSAEFAAAPKVDAGSPLYWFRASEIHFLKAEAALYGLCDGDAQTHYENGIVQSFKENGVGLGDYLSRTGMPLDITPYTLVFNRSYSCTISSENVSPQWNRWGGTEKQLQQIMTQKYLALYPNAVEAWTEYRRTGYPFLMKPADKSAHSRIGADASVVTPERFRYSPLEYKNPNLKDNIETLLGGPDQGATKLWWVRDNRPKQP